VIIGFSGPYGAGKGEAVDYLRERSFYPLSLSDILRDELAKQGLSETRERMIEIGNALRAEHGPGVLAERLGEKFLSDRNYVIDSIRHPAEVEALRNADPSFRLVWVDADPKIRMERIKSRGRSGDPVDLKDLKRLEGKELESDNPAAQQLLAVKALKDFTVLNEDSMEDMHQAVQHVLERSQNFERPSWDTYFMQIAHVVASRSNCVKRKVAAVITLDKRIISTGYNGTPRGTKNCNEGGCPRCNSFAKGGTRLDECLCSHGEENAITQASYHGTSVRGGTLYSTMSPCLFCTKLIINSGIKEEIYNSHYPLGDTAMDLLRESGVELRQYEEDVTEPE
jgi:dCMP deaminase